MQLSSTAHPYPASAMTFPFKDDYTKIAGELQMNRFGAGLEMRVDGQTLVFGDPKALSGFTSGDIVEVTGAISKNQFSFHQSGTNYSVATAQAFSGFAHLTTSGKAIVFSNGRISGLQG